MKKIGILILASACAAGSAGALAATPVKEVVAKLVRANLPETAGATPTDITAGEFVAGDAPGRVLAAVRVSWEYYDEVYAALFVARDGEWELAALEDAVAYMPEMGGDAGTITAVDAGGRTYYAFTCTEASYGTGMGTENDYYRLYVIADDKLTKVFDGTTRDEETVFSRWYGGEDSTAWQDGGYYEKVTDYAFMDVAGDGVAEVWATARERTGEEGPVRYVSSELYALGADGTFAPAPATRFAQALEREDTWEANLLLGDAALRDDGDVARGLAYYERAAAIWPGAGGIEDKIGVLKRLAQDPAEAVRSYFQGELRAVLDNFPKSAAAAEATLTQGNFRECLTFLRERRDHPRWTDVYVGAVVEALYADTYDEEGTPTAKDLAELKKYLPRYLELAPAADQAEQLTRVGDCFFNAGDAKTARGYYERSLEADAESIFMDYNQLRMGDCAEAAGDAAKAIEAYFDALAADGWWSAAAADKLVAYAAVRDGAGEVNFLDYLDADKTSPSFAVAAGDLDGDAADDLAVVATDYGANDVRADQLFSFLRRGDGFVGERLAAGETMWLPEVTNPFGAGAALLSVRETKEDAGGRVGLRTFYRDDGSRMREVARLKVEEYAPGEPPRRMTAEVTITPGPAPTLTLSGTVKDGAGEKPIREEYKWDEASYSFIRQQESDTGAR